MTAPDGTQRTVEVGAEILLLLDQKVDATLVCNKPSILRRSLFILGGRK